MTIFTRERGLWTFRLSGALRDTRGLVLDMFASFVNRERVQISASGHADADQSGADFFRFRFQSVPIETESAPFKILHRAN